MHKLVRLLPVLGLVALISCRSAPLADPGQIQVASQSKTQMKEAIERALARRGWAITDQQPGLIHATLYVRAHVAKIRITYDDTAFDIDYVDSDNLEYRRRPDGTEVIHENYNSWIRYLVHDISVLASHGE